MDAAMSLDEPQVSVTGVAVASPTPRREALTSLVIYFLKLGTIGFGGPVALVGFMHRDLVERRRIVAEDTYRLALAFAQIMPGPLAPSARSPSATSSKVSLVPRWWGSPSCCRRS
jgi:hypothetical protein